MASYKGWHLIPARGNGKSLIAMKFYEELLKGENNMSFKTELANYMNEYMYKHLDKYYGVPAIDIHDGAKPDPTSEVKTEEEEWIWVKGFKGMDRDMRCHGGYQYEIGKQFDMPDGVDVEVCCSGFHFCSQLTDVFNHYSFGNGNRFFEVEGLVRKKDMDDANWYWTYPTNGRKFVAKSIKIIRELTVDEVFEVPNHLYDDTITWTEDQKKRAMETSIDKVRKEIHINDLVEAGYSRVFANYISLNHGRYTTAMAVASMPDVSMDVKVMAIFMDNRN